jgi:hypothetical protein
MLNEVKRMKAAELTARHVVVDGEGLMYRVANIERMVDTISFEISDYFEGMMITEVSGKTVRVKASDLLNVIEPSDPEPPLPPALAAQLLRYAASDMRRARKERAKRGEDGSLLICQTRRGLLELSYDPAAKLYRLFSNDGATLDETLPAGQMQALIASLYNVADALNYRPITNELPPAVYQDWAAFRDAVKPQTEEHESKARARWEANRDAAEREV